MADKLKMVTADDFRKRNEEIRQRKEEAKRIVNEELLPMFAQKVMQAYESRTDIIEVITLMDYRGLDEDEVELVRKWAEDYGFKLANMVSAVELWIT